MSSRIVDGLTHHDLSELSLEIGLDKYIIRTSDRLSFKKCRRQWNWSSILRENLVPNKGSKPLEFGTTWHHGNALFYEPLTWHLVKNPNTRGPVLESIKASFVRHNRETKKAYEHETGQYALEVDEDFDERESLGLKMLDHYFEWAETNVTFTPVYIEVDFEVPILTPDGKPMYYPAPGSTVVADPYGRFLVADHTELWPVFYQGRLDGIAVDEFGFYWILEHKSTGQMGSTEHLVLDEQTGSYMWALQYSLGIRVRGVIYIEALKDFPEPPVKLKRMTDGRNYSINKSARTTYELALKTLTEANEPLALYEDYLEFLKLEGNKFVKMTKVPRNQNELKEMGERIYLEALDMLNPNISLYPNPSKFACSYCAFRGPCIATNEGSDVNFILNQEFRKRTKVEVDARRARA